VLPTSNYLASLVCKERTDIHADMLTDGTVASSTCQRYAFVTYQ